MVQRSDHASLDAHTHHHASRSFSPLTAHLIRVRAQRSGMADDTRSIHGFELVHPETAPIDFATLLRYIR